MCTRLAQSVERLTFNQVVGGSSPPSGVKILYYFMGSKKLKRGGSRFKNKLSSAIGLAKGVTNNTRNSHLPAARTSAKNRSAFPPPVPNRSATPALSRRPSSSASLFPQPASRLATPAKSSSTSMPASNSSAFPPPLPSRSARTSAKNTLASMPASNTLSRTFAKNRSASLLSPVSNRLALPPPPSRSASLLSPVSNRSADNDPKFSNWVKATSGSSHPVAPYPPAPGESNNNWRIRIQNNINRKPKN